MGDVSRMLDINVTRDREKERSPSTRSTTRRTSPSAFVVKDCNPAFTPGAGPGLSLKPPEKKIAGRGREAAVPVNHRRRDVPRTDRFLGMTASTP